MAWNCGMSRGRVLRLTGFLSKRRRWWLVSISVGRLYELFYEVGPDRPTLVSMARLCALRMYGPAVSSGA